VLADLLRLGVAAGEFTCADPDATAWRLTALLDGLGLQVTVHEGLLTHAQLLGYVHTAVATELGMTEAAFADAARRVTREVA